MTSQTPGPEPAPDPDPELVPEDDRVIGVAFRWSVGVMLVVAAIVVVAWIAWPDGTTEVRPDDDGIVIGPRGRETPTAPLPDVPFVSVGTGVGIDFVHESGAAGEKLLPETMGGGCAVFDPDGDGDQDLLFVNGRAWPHDGGEVGTPGLALFRNDGDWRFTDVTAEAGLAASFYGMGPACGDIDGDGDVDLFVTAVGENRLFRNEGGRFTEITSEAGVAGRPDGWSSGAGFFDADGDGDLDLFVCNYVEWSRAIDLELNYTINGTDRAYGPPYNYRGTYCELFRNDGDGRFTDVSVESGVRIENVDQDAPAGKSLAVTFADVDGNGHADVVVANDTVANFFFLNRGDGTFEERGVASGLAFNSEGDSTGAMGVDIADIHNNGRLAIAIGNFANEPSSLYIQQREPWSFSDRAAAEGVGSPSRLRLTFGVLFLDVDLDGRLDFLQANGHLEDEIEELQPNQRYRQRAQLFHNAGVEARPRFVVMPAERIGALVEPIVGRAATTGDLDDDGDLDVVLTQIGGAPLVLRNDQQTGHHWLRVTLRGTRGPRDAIGAWVELTAGGVTQRRQVMPTRSYLTQTELPVVFGLGASNSVEALRVRWPSGATQDVEPPGVDRMIEIVEP